MNNKLSFIHFYNEEMLGEIKMTRRINCVDIMFIKKVIPCLKDL